VVEDRYSAIFKLNRVRPALVADDVAELQVRCSPEPGQRPPGNDNDGPPMSL
jgi:hypothetical protein